jgi:hypothetical protein
MELVEPNLSIVSLVKWKGLRGDQADLCEISRTHSGEYEV